MDLSGRHRVDIPGKMVVNDIKLEIILLIAS